MAKTTIKSLQARIEQLQDLLKREELRRRDVEESLSKRSGELREANENAKEHMWKASEAERLLATVRAAVLDYFMALSNATTKEDSEHIKMLQSTITGIVSPVAPRKEKWQFQ